MLVLCAGCGHPIEDRFLLTVVDRMWHSSCVRCYDCHCPLLDRCFSRDGHQLFCKMDFFRRFGSKCGGCKQGIAPTDLVRRARDCVYHVTCFNCTVCGRQLSTGDEMYILDDSRFICKDDFSLQTMENTHSVALSNVSSVVDAISPASASASSAAAPVPATKKHLDHPQKQPSYDKLRGSDDDVDDNDDNEDDDDDDEEKDEGTSVNGDESRDSVALPSHVMNDATLFPASVACVERSSGSTLRRSAAAAGGGGGDGDGEDQYECVINNNHSNCSLDSNCSDENSNPRFSENPDKDRDKENAKQDEALQGATKRRGPRTTIKAKQLETLKSAFAATPKPTRHIREQLAQETGLNMRVIQVWFQNRRSKERRMKQLSAMGVRRQFFRSPRRLRTTVLRPGDEFNSDATTDHQHPHPLLTHHHHRHHSPAAAAVAMAYFGETTDFYSTYPSYDEFFALHGPSTSSSAAAAADSLSFIPSHPSSMATVGEAIVIEQVSSSSHLVNVAVDAFTGHHQSLMQQQHHQQQQHPASATIPTASAYLHQQPQQQHQQPQAPVEPHEQWN